MIEGFIYQTHILDRFLVPIIEQRKEQKQMDCHTTSTQRQHVKAV